MLYLVGINSMTLCVLRWQSEVSCATEGETSSYSDYHFLIQSSCVWEGRFVPQPLEYTTLSLCVRCWDGIRFYLIIVYYVLKISYRTSFTPLFLLQSPLRSWQLCCVCRLSLWVLCSFNWWSPNTQKKTYLLSYKIEVSKWSPA